MGLKMPVSDPDCDGLEFEIISYDFSMDFFCQLLQYTQNPLLIIHVLLEGGVPAYRLGFIFLYHFTVIDANGKFMQPVSPCSEKLFQNFRFHGGKILNSLDPKLQQCLFGLSSNSGDLSNFQWEQEILDIFRLDYSQTIGFPIVRCNLGNHLIGSY